MGLSFGLLPILGKLLVGHHYQEMLPRVRAAVGGGALAREARLHCGHAERHERRATGWTWGGRAVRDSALVGGGPKPPAPRPSGSAFDAGRPEGV